MKYGELKIECLRVLDEEGVDEITLVNLVDYENSEALADIYRRMPGAINRGMDRMAAKKIIPAKVYELECSINEGNSLVFDLKLINDFRNIIRVDFLGDAYYASVDFRILGGKLLIPNKAGCKVMIVYNPTAPSIKYDTDNETEIDLPEELCRLLAIYVASEIAETEEPELALSNRNKFEALIEEVSFNEENEFDKTINKVYRI